MESGVNKNIFLTGKPGVGKSTILKQVMELLQINAVGFCTLPYYIEGVRQGFYLSGLVEAEVYNNNTPISVQVGSMRCVGITETFETLGVEVLETSLKQDKWILMDELGRLEKSAGNFQKQVLKCLDSDQGVLGVIKSCEEPWLNNIKSREDISVFEVTEENREDVLQKVLIEIERIIQ